LIKERFEDFNKLEEEISSLKTQLEEARRAKEATKFQMLNKEEDYEKCEKEVVSLRVEVDKLNKNLKTTQVLADILSHQQSPYDKSGLGYTGEASSKFRMVKCKEKLEAIILQKSNHRESQEKDESIARPRSYDVALKGSIH